MSFDIASVAGMAPAAPVQSTQAVSAPTAPAAQSESVSVDTIPTSPPDEVKDAMGVAAQAYQNLKDDGSELRFKINEKTGKLTVEVHDTHGNLMFTLPASKVLDIASGGSLQ